MVVIEMSQRDGFTGGFLAGAVVGGIVGAVIGTLVASRVTDTEATDASLLNSGTPEAKVGKVKKPRLKDTDSIEVARRSLEDKIAQLNTAIDQVRTQLGPVNGNVQETEKERSLES